MFRFLLKHYHYFDSLELRTLSVCVCVCVHIMGSQSDYNITKAKYENS
jgi:hypothetical protein